MPTSKRKWTGGKSNDEAGEESALAPRKSQRLRNTGRAKAAAHDSSNIQEGSAALIEGTSTGVQPYWACIEGGHTGANEPEGDGWQT
jgi:hypothetical protein